MGGLLYKDYVSVNRIGKVNLSWLVVIISLLFLILRIAFPGVSASNEIVVTNDNDQRVILIDLIFVSVYGLLIVAVLSLINSFIGKIVDCDDKSKIVSYIKALPIEKNTYVASKYIFIGIAAYIFLSVCYIWGVICTAFCEEGYALEIMNMLMGFIVSIISIAVLSAAIELPLFILLGKGTAQLIKIGIWTIIAFIAIGYVMFGDLDKIDKILNINKFIAFVNHHITGVTIIQSMMPIFILALYYMSYRITCHFCGKKDK